MGGKNSSMGLGIMDQVQEHAAKMQERLVQEHGKTRALVLYETVNSLFALKTAAQIARTSRNEVLGMVLESARDHMFLAMSAALADPEKVLTDPEAEAERVFNLIKKETEVFTKAMDDFTSKSFHGA